MNDWIYTVLTCYEKSGKLTVEYEGERSASERMGSQYRPLTTYLNIMAQEGWEFLDMVSGSRVKREKNPYELYKNMPLSWKFLRLFFKHENNHPELLFEFDGGSKRIYIILRRPKMLKTPDVS